MFSAERLGNLSTFRVAECQNKETRLIMKNSAMIKNLWVSSSSRSTFLSIWWGRNEGLKNNNNACNTSSKSEFIWFSSYNCSYRDIGQIQSLAAAGYRAYELNCPGSFKGSSKATSDAIWKVKDFPYSVGRLTHKNSYKAVDCWSFKFSI